MKTLILQHVPFEDAGHITEWLERNHHEVTVAHLYKNDGGLTRSAWFDCLIIMGGPMNVYEEELYPWLATEKNLIKEAIETGKAVLGICLGAQLIASVLGATVRKNPHKEIGWFPCKLTHEGCRSFLFSKFPKNFEALHWHGDTFDLPDGALLIASSDACVHQAFVYKERVVGLQFHLESTGLSIERLIDNCKSELIAGKFIQTIDDLRQKHFLPQAHTLMESLLEAMSVLKNTRAPIRNKSDF